MKHNTGIKLAAARAHGNTIHRGKAHAAGLGAAIGDGAERGTIAKMRHNQPPLGKGGILGGHAPCDILIGKAVKAEAANAFSVILRRQAIGIGDKGLGAMKRRIKTGNLRHTPKAFRGGSNAG